MKTKLTLSIDKDLVKIARIQADKEDTSISELFSNFIITRKLKTEENDTPSVSSMIGSLKAYAIDDSKAAIRSAYAQKYLG